MMKQEKAAYLKILDIIILIFSFGMLLFLASYAFLLWETPDRLVLIFVPAILILWSLHRVRNGTFLPLQARWNLLLGVFLIAVLAYSAYYLYTEFYSLLNERAANNNLTDMVIAAVLIVLVIISTWRETGWHWIPTS